MKMSQYISFAILGTNLSALQPSGGTAVPSAPIQSESSEPQDSFSLHHRVLSGTQFSEPESSFCICFSQCSGLSTEIHFQLRNETRVFQRKMFCMKYLNVVETISNVELNVLCDNGSSNLSSLQVGKKDP